jgi:hypothetical protein
MKTASKTSQSQKDLSRGEQLMKMLHATLTEKKVLSDSIKSAMERCTAKAKEAEMELLEIGERNKGIFTDGNLTFTDGYLHIANSAVVVTGKKFDINVFHGEHPEMVEIKMKTGEIKKAFQDKALRKELISLGVQIDNEQSLQVIANKI